MSGTNRPADAFQNTPMKDRSAESVPALTLKGWLLGHAGPFLTTWRPLFWAAAIAAASAAFGYFVVWPSNTASAKDQLDDVPTAWNKTISRLGIMPMYPPQEDFYVGDVWAVIVNTRTNPGPGGLLVPHDPLLGSAARIGNIDLSALLQAGEAQRIHFRQAAKAPNGEQGQAMASPSGQPEHLVSSLSIAAFPGVTIARDRQASTSFGARLFGWAASGRDSSVEEIAITQAYSYGVSAIEALDALEQWCAAPETGWRCDDRIVRNVLQRVGIEEAAKRNPENTAYAYAIELRLVTRAYLTTKLDQRWTSDSARSALAGSAQPGNVPSEADPADPAALPSGGSAGSQESPPPAAVRSQQGGTAGVLRSNGTQVSMHRQSFERPVVFGYRAISKQLVTSIPEGDAP